MFRTRGNFLPRYYIKRICENELAKLEPARHDTSKNNLTDFYEPIQSYYTIKVLCCY